jgi:phage-related minor tail protein
MKLVDINAEIKEMEDYTNSLTKIKGKVSSALFDEITSYDMKEGKAFVERLLSMSDKQLKAYSNSYDKKLSLADQLANNVYQSDLDKVAKKYDAAIEKAFNKLPKQLKTIGTQTMQGFINGLGNDGKYLKSSITNIVNTIVNTFKKQLKISSPSKVMEELGEYTGEGFADGLMSMVKAVKDAAEEITDTVTSSLDWQSEIDGARGTIQTAAGATGINRSAGTFEGAGTQVINFNQTNNSPKALDRLTLYRQTNNLIFGAKVRLADV